MKYIKETLAFAPILGLTRSRLTHREDSAMGTQTRLFKVHPFLPELKNDQRGGRFSRGGSSPQQHMDSEEPELIQRWAGALVLPAFQTFSVPCSQFATTKITKTLSLSASWIWTPPTSYAAQVQLAPEIMALCTTWAGTVCFLVNHALAPGSGPAPGTEGTPEMFVEESKLYGFSLGFLIPLLHL